MFTEFTFEHLEEQCIVGCGGAVHCGMWRIIDDDVCFSV